MTILTDNAVDWFIEHTDDTQTQKIIGDDSTFADIFELVCAQHNLRYEMLILLNKNGLIISNTILSQDINLCGRTLNSSALNNCPFEIICINSDLGYTIISTHHINANNVLTNIKDTVDTFAKIIFKSQEHNQHLLKCLDALNTAISIFDSDAHLLFTNKNFCTLFNIEDPQSVLGMHIDNIMKQYGISISPLNKATPHLKMFDVLKTGEAELGWEIVLESKFHPSPIQLAENDILPIFDDNRNIIGVIDVFRSYKQDLQRSKKFIALSANYKFTDIVHTSEIMEQRIALAKKMSQNNSTVLITGESGVGKELFAQSIHNYSNRKNNSFVALNCASFPSELITSELFGYEAGAFTDASKKGHVGKFELADGGTLFLDEISELPYDSQSKLLRVLETWVITRVGGSKEIPVNIRLIAASNKDLPQMVEKGLFREDLYYRLQTLTLQIPPLRQRRSDILPLCKFFLMQCAQQNDIKAKKIRADAISSLQNYDWPGNIRELKNVMTSISLLSRDDVITAKTIDEHFHPNENFNKNINDDSPEDRISSIKNKIHHDYRALLNEALILTNGHKGKAAELIGVSRKTFYRMLEKYS